MGTSVSQLEVEGRDGWVSEAAVRGWPSMTEPGHERSPEEEDNELSSL